MRKGVKTISYLLAGLTVADTARKVGISERQVKRYKAIYEKESGNKIPRGKKLNGEAKAEIREVLHKLNVKPSEIADIIGETRQSTHKAIGAV